MVNIQLIARALTTVILMAFHAIHIHIILCTQTYVRSLLYVVCAIMVCEMINSLLKICMEICTMKLITIVIMNQQSHAIVIILMIAQP